MKATLKVNVIIHVEDPDAHSLDYYTPEQQLGESERRKTLSYPISVHIAGVRDVMDKADAERLAESIRHSIEKSCGLMGITPVGISVLPDLQAVKNGHENGHTT